MIIPKELKLIENLIEEMWWELAPQSSNSQGKRTTSAGAANLGKKRVNTTTPVRDRQHQLVVVLLRRKGNA